MALNRFHVVSPLALIAFSACRSPYTGGGAVGGAVVNGPLNSALVFLDYDFDGILDANEPSARTNQFGEYELTSTRDLYDLVAIADDQTVDTSSGATFAGITLKAPSGAGVISPTSTLMKEGDLTASEVAAVLGLPDGVDPLSFNPFNIDESDAAAVAKALEVAKISKQITTAISSFASATEGAGADAADAFNTALNSVVDVVKTKAAKAKDANASLADKKLDFTAATDLDLIKAQVTTKATDLKGLDTATLNALADDTTAAVKNVNTQIKAVTNLKADATKDLFSTTQVLRDQIKDVAIARKEGKAGEITFKDPNAVKTAMNNKAPEGITLSGDRLISPDKGSLVVGKLATIDSDQGSGVAFTYNLAGKDADMFSFNASTGELSLKAKPDYSKKPFYEVTVITKDDGGKKYAETFKIDVVPEFKGLVAPTSKAAADFEQIIKENPLFKDMVNHMELKQTPDGQLVLEEKGQGLSADAPKPILAVVKVTERGYELHNPANDEYMSGFFKYETGGLTYTGYEVFIPNQNMLGENQKDLFKYFSANNAYSSKKLPFSERDADFISLVGAKVTDKDGKVISDMYGFNHYDKTMTVLGSTGIDIANASNPLYIEVAGEFVPGVTTNITTTALTKANADLMKAVIEKAGGAVLYGEKETTFGKENSYPVQTLEVEAGKNVVFKYKATDVSDLASVYMVFRDEFNNSLQFYDKDNDGIISGNVDYGTANGTYKLYRIDLRDDNLKHNSIQYFTDKTYITKGGQRTEEPPDSEFNADFLQSHQIKVTGGLPEQTDISAPVWQALDLGAASFSAGDTVKVKYTATDTGLGVNYASFLFKGPNSTIFDFMDYDNDGIATARLNKNLPAGEYSLDVVNLSDMANSSNQVIYEKDKVTLREKGDFIGITKNPDPNFNFDNYKIKITANQTDISSDTAKPTISAITLDNTDVKFGDRISWKYTADGTGSDVNSLYLKFTNEHGQNIELRDNDGDGVASYLMGYMNNKNTKDGLYKLTQVELEDKAGNYAKLGEYYGNSDLAGTSFGQLSFKYTGLIPPSSDTEKPTVSSVAIVGSADIKFGDRIKLKYSADGTGSDINSYSAQFENAKGDFINVHSRGGQNETSLLLDYDSHKNHTSGEYKLTRFDVYDMAGNQMHVQGSELLDTSYGNLSFKFTNTYDSSAAQTDFDPPELDFITLIEPSEII